MQKYKTSDLSLAAFLVSQGVELLQADKDPQDRKVFFIFEDSASLNDLVTKFLTRTASVDLSTYKDSERMLRKLAHGEITLRGRG